LFRSRMVFCAVRRRSRTQQRSDRKEEMQVRPWSSRATAAAHGTSWVTAESSASREHQGALAGVPPDPLASSAQREALAPRAAPAVRHCWDATPAQLVALFGHTWDATAAQLVRVAERFA